MAISQIVQNSLANTISLGPKITSVQVANSSYTVLDDTSINIGGGYIVITGSGFQSNCSVIVDSNLACSVAFVSATQVRAQLPAKAAGTYNIYLLNGDGGTAIRVNALQYSNTPTWVTTSPLASQIEDTNVSIQLSATGANTYVLQAGSTLPTGLTLSANGLISGTVNTNVSVATTYNFTVEAIDTENQETPKAFAVTITVDMIIPRSLRINPADSAYLSRTPGSAGNRRIWTWSGWVKRTEFVQYGGFFTAWSSNDDAGYAVIRFDDDKLLFKDWSPTTILQTTQVFRDPSAWYHIVVAMDTTQGTASNRLRMYVNGSEITSFASSTYPSLNQQFNINNNVLHTLGVNYFSSTPTYFFGGYLAEVHFVDGTALTPSTFGQFDNKNGGVWVPKTVTGVTYGTNGFYLPFSDNTSTTTLGNDGTANNNDWTLNNFSVTAGAGNDSLLDTPTNSGTDDGSGADVTGSYAVLNGLSVSSGTISDGGLKYVGPGSWSRILGTVGVSTGKWYYEVTVTGNPYTPRSGTTAYAAFGFSVPTSHSTTAPASATDSVHFMDNGYSKNFSSTQADSGSAIVSGDVLSVAVDLDANTYVFRKNNSIIASGTIGGTAGRELIPVVWSYDASQSVFIPNFGQRPFAYTAPSGFKTLSSHNLPTGIDANTSSTLANSYFGVVTYTGTGSELNVTGLNFDPDFVWIKMRSSGDVHVLVDKVRGDDGTRMFVLNTDNTSTEALRTESTTAVVKSSSWPSNGFRVGTNGQTNSGSGTYVAFCWKANGSSTVTNTSGSISSDVSFNPTTKFSIVKYTSPNNSSNQTVGHGLGVKPAFIIVKNRDGSANWDIYHKDLGYNASLTFSGAATRSGAFGAEPTSTLFTTVNDFTHYLTNKFVAYCWAEVEGFSKFGSYTGNGSTDGPFVYCGFRPAFVMVKRTNNTYDWKSWNSGSLAYNPNDKAIWPNLNNAEGNGHPVDFLANGFKIRGNDLIENSSGGPYIFAAWAQTPLEYARAR
jgi:hypothetical protein